jgi:hypothetical protein
MAGLFGIDRSRNSILGIDASVGMRCTRSKSIETFTCRAIVKFAFNSVFHPMYHEAEMAFARLGLRPPSYHLARLCMC